MRRTTLSLLLLSSLIAGCGNVSSSSTKQPPPPPSGTVSVSISPTTASIRSGDSYSFSATVTGSSNTSVNWSINSTPGGNATLGTVNSSGNYTSPSTIPNPNTVTLTATSAADSSKSASSTITL
ncbi:MAG TPA: hypothetical protein VLX60_07140, partial [Terriglobales bacterium]|nr:hypothetical protein [Terriglobales bacterium]